MKNQSIVSMAITGLMLKTYINIARSWATASKTIRDVKELTSSVRALDTIDAANA